MPRSILQLQREAENLSDERLIQEAQNPQFLPSYLVMQELKRREDDRQIQAEAKAAENTPSTDVFSGLIERSVAATQQQAQNPFGGMDPQMAAETMRLMDPRQEQVRNALSGVGSIPNTVNLAGGGIVPEYSNGGMIDPLEDPEDDPPLPWWAREAYLKRVLGVSEDEFDAYLNPARYQNVEELLGSGRDAAGTLPPEATSISFIPSGPGVFGDPFANQREERAQEEIFREAQQAGQEAQQAGQSASPRVPHTDVAAAQAGAQGFNLDYFGNLAPRPESLEGQIKRFSVEDQNQRLREIIDSFSEEQPDIANEFESLRNLNRSGLGGIRTEIPSIDFAPMFADARARAEGLGQMTAEERALSDVERKDAARYRGLIDERQNLEDRRNLALSRASQRILGRDVEGSTYDAIIGLRDSQRQRDELLEEKAVALDRARLARTAGARRDALNKVAEIDAMIAATRASSEAQRVSAQAELDQALRVEKIRNDLSIALAQIRSQSDLERTKVQFAEQLRDIAMGSSPDDILKLYELALQDPMIEDQGQRAMVLRTLREAALQHFNIALDPVAERESTQQRSSGSGMG